MRQHSVLENAYPPKVNTPKVYEFGASCSDVFRFILRCEG